MASSKLDRGKNVLCRLAYLKYALEKSTPYNRGYERFAPSNITPFKLESVSNSFWISAIRRSNRTPVVCSSWMPASLRRPTATNACCTSSLTIGTPSPETNRGRMFVSGRGPELGGGQKRKIGSPQADGSVGGPLQRGDVMPLSHRVGQRAHDLRAVRRPSRGGRSVRLVGLSPIAAEPIQLAVRTRCSAASRISELLCPREQGRCCV